MSNQFGAVLVFHPEMRREDCQNVIARLKAEGVLDDRYFVGGMPPVSEFNPEFGGPVWYVP